MNDSTPDPNPPRLRGLAPAKLLGVLAGAADQLPEIPGWQVLGVAGKGGFGTVWKAVRERDGAIAAVKIARPDDPDTLDRIESEASILASLDHPDIVRLLDSGPLDDSEGGMFLAMEFIDGTELSQMIPPDGLDVERAFAWFLRIAGAVAHAHDAGVLHRDLKPANILVDAVGGVHVADFGLALPVHRRVHQLSLTRAGMVAGTAEYLPPEAYRKGYKPTVATDVFALGVILHEMLRGAPPRGAWPPVSTVRRVDVRIDGIILRALDPDPTRRWPDVKSLSDAVVRVLESPPRFDGAPIVSRGVRALDGIWTLLGTAALAAGVIGVDHFNQAGGDSSREFLGIHGRLLGGFAALFVTLMLLLPLSLWQGIRLWRFRGVPLREALPMPLGLCPGYNRPCAVLAACGQLLFLLLPAFACIVLANETCRGWLQAGDPAWLHGLVVTRWDDSFHIIDPWQPGDPGKRYWLMENFGPPGHPLAGTVSRIEFFPLLVPLGMGLSGVLLCLVVMETAFFALRSWWARRRIAAVALLVGIALAPFAIRGTEAHAVAAPGEPQLNVGRFAEPLRPLSRALLGILPVDRRDVVLRIAGLVYAGTVDYRDQGNLPRNQVLQGLAQKFSPKADSLSRGFDFAWNPADRSFRSSVEAVVFPDNSNGSGADAVRIEFDGLDSGNGYPLILRERWIREPLYRADAAVLEMADAEQWAAGFRSALQSGAAPNDESWLALFHPGQIRFAPDASLGFGQRAWNHLEAILGPIRRNPPCFLDAAVEIRDPLPGGRTRIAMPVHTNQPRSRRRWIADLIHADGQWRAVDIFVESK